jgi:TolB-like protein/DNA-binding winged helix-turn-helix (wHTH) protein/Tfp pilus assembly protein PilF
VAGSSTGLPTWKFAAFELDARAGELRKDGVVIKLQPQPFKVLALLVEHAGELVSREELKKALWGEETYVDFERGLNFCINQARAALGDAAESPQFIQTIPRRGYRFIAPVTRSESIPNPFRVDSEPAPNRFRVDPEPVQSEVTTRLKVGWQAVTVGVAFLATLVGGATFLARRPNAPPAATGSRTMIAVLPLDDLSSEASPAWFADGLTEELIAQLGRVSPQRLGVIARTSAMVYRGSNKTIADIGRELGVSHVVEGSIRRDGSRIRVTAQLVSVRDQSHVWSETYDRTVEGALTIQSEVAAQVTRALALELLPARLAAPASAATRSPAAHDAYMRGRYFLTRGMPGDTRTAVDNFEEAVRLDPQFARGHAAVAAAYHWLAMSGQLPPRDAYQRAATAAREAVRLDSDLADAHDAVGLVQLWSDWNPAAAATSFTRALTLNPSDATAHHDLAWSLVALQRFDEAVSHITRAYELDPLSPRASNDIGWLYLHTRQPSEAARACRHTLSLDPDSVEAQQCLERAHLQRGELLEALRAARDAVARGRGALPAALDDHGPPASRIQALWRWRLERLEALERERPISPYTLAMHHVVLGEDEEALRRLEQAYEARASVMVLLPGDPVFERLRAYPRFMRLVDLVRQRRD